MIVTPEALASVCSRARTLPAVALDTEFVWERSFYPALGLIQIGLGGDDVHLVDTVALTGDDLAPLGDLIADPAVQVVLHDALQDLQILARATSATPRNVFDTQRAAGFVGLSATLSLQDLIQWSNGLTLDKGATRTDWLRRPLSDRQLDYAEADVLYLLDARAKIVAEARRLGRLDWLRDEMNRYEEPSAYVESDPMDAVDRVKARNLNRLTGAQRATLRHVAAWREREARDLDRTRRMVLPDDVLVALAQHSPSDHGGLRKAGLTDRQLKRYAQGLLDALDAGAQAEPERRERRGRPGPEDERRQALLLLAQAFLAGRCTRQDLDATLVATKNDLRALVEACDAPSRDDHQVLQGWRFDFAGRDILRLLSGDLAVAVSDSDGWPEAAQAR